MTTTIVSTSSTQSKVQIGGVDVISLDQTKGIVGLPSAAAPAFSYTATGSTSVANTGVNKVLYATMEFDTAAAVSSSRFTPLVAGYYFIKAAINMGGPTAANNTMSLLLSKNGTASNTNYFSILTLTTVANEYPAFEATGLVYLNGSTDYVEVYASQNGTGTINSGAAAPYARFQGFLVRPA